MFQLSLQDKEEISKCRKSGVEYQTVGSAHTGAGGCENLQRVQRLQETISGIWRGHEIDKSLVTPEYSG